jgi:hypothetical protein
LGNSLCAKEIRNDATLRRNGKLMNVMAKKYQFFAIPAEAFSFRSRPRLLNEFQIGANTNAFKASV